MPQIQYVSSAQKTLPSAANSITLTASGTAWTNPASYTQIVASAPSAGTLTGVVVTTDELTNRVQFEIDIAVGAAASEVVLATIKGLSFATSGTSSGSLTYVFPVGIGAWVAGNRLSARVRVSNTVASHWTIALMYYEFPLVGSFLLTTQVLKVLPSNSVIDLPTGGSAWANGAYQQYSASLATDIAVIGLVAGPSFQNGDYQFEIDIATGSAGNEVVAYTFRGHVDSFVAVPWYTALPVPLGLTAGSRVALRARDHQSFPYNGQTYGVDLLYLGQPL